MRKGVLLWIAVVFVASVANAQTYTWDQSSVTVAESAGTVPLNVLRSATAAQPVTVTFALGGSATRDSDYSVPSTQVVFQPADTTKPVNVQIIDDGRYEGTPENITLTITTIDPSTGATIGVPSQVQITINENDAASFMRLSSNSYTASEGAGVMPVTILRSGDTTATSSVNFNPWQELCSAVEDVDFGNASQVVTFLPGETSKTINVPMLQDSFYEGTECFQIIISETIASQPPMNGAIESPSVAAAFITDDDTPATVQLSSDAYSVNENAGPLVVTVTRAGATGNIARGRITTGTPPQPAPIATPGQDYTPLSDFLVEFAAGETSKDVSIPIGDDLVYEGDEQFKITLTASMGAVLGSPSTAVATIVENDVAPVLTLGSTTYSVDEDAASGAAVIDIHRSGPTISETKVVCTTTNQSATAGSDYHPINDFITFAPGATVAQCAIPLINDSASEGNETLSVRIRTPVNGVVGSPDEAVVTIVDDEDPPPPPPATYQFASASYAVGESAGSASVTLQRTSGTSTASSVVVRTIAGSATAGADYTHVETTVTFDAGEATKNVAIPILQDSAEEPTEQFVVQADSAPLVQTTVQINDDDAAAAVSFSFNAVGYWVSEDDLTVVIRVIRSGNTSGTDTVTLSAVEASAAHGTDFVEDERTIVFAPGENEKEAAFTIVQDSNAEPSEWFEVLLIRGMEIDAATVTIDDDDAPAPQSFSYASFGSSTLTLDLYRPASPPFPGFRSPLVIWLDSGDVEPEAIRLLDHGYAVAVVHYREFGDATHPEPFGDVMAAVQWLREHGDARGVDTSRLIAWGKGIGGFLAAHLGTSGLVRGAIVWAAPADLAMMIADSTCGVDRSLATAILGCRPSDCPADAADANPANNASSGDSPFLIMHGEHDCEVPVEQARRLAASLTAAGIDVTLRTYPGVEHDDPFWSSPAAMEEVEAFIERVEAIPAKRRAVR